MPEVIQSVEIAAAPSAVWRWMTSQEALRKWLSPNIEIEVRVGGSYRMKEIDTWISGYVLEIVPEGGLTLSWFEEGGSWVHPTRLLIALTPTPAGTRVTLSHDGFAGIGKPGWPETVQAYERGADAHDILGRLKTLVLGADG